MVEFLTLHEIAKQARRNLPQTAWDYLTGGCETETTLRRNRAAIDSLAFRPRVLRDVNNIDLTGSFLGRKCRIPVLLAPIGSLESFDPGAAVTVAKAAKEFGTTAFLSSVTHPDMEQVGAVGHDMVFQLYVRGDDAWVDDYVRRAKALGCTGFCLTVDTQVYSRRERDLIKRYIPAGRRTAVGYDWQAGLTWDLVKRLKDTMGMPLILKGIATAEDAQIALEHGVDVIYVSNHGGRQLDHGLGAIDVLPEVVKAVGGQVPVVIDSGFMRGTDVVKALALGASAVAIGKVQGLGLAAGGQAGLVRVLEILEEEMKSAMGLLGCTKFEQLSPKYIAKTQPAYLHYFESAFHHVNLYNPEY